MSANSITPVTSISEITMNTTVVALTKFEPRSGTRMSGLEPAIHRNIASKIRASMIHSLRDIGPISASSFDAHSEISGLLFTSGRQTA
jgi:hypothetical protein